jgi:hypothetical protein
MLFASLLLATQLIPSSGLAPGSNVQRTMRLLEEGKPVKVMFYGQSITTSDWVKQVESELRAKFPKAQLQAVNMAIAGFSANLLKRTAERDNLEQYPDLIILHVYGGEPDYEELVRTLRSTSTAELLLQSDHIHGLPTGRPEDKDKDRGFLWHDQHSAWLRKIADPYGCGFVDIRASWYSELDRTKRPWTDYVQADKVHLNAEGDRLMAELTAAYLRRDKALEKPNPIAEHAVEDGTMTFTGNRIDIRLEGAEGPVRILIDGKRPSEFANLYLPSRATPALGAWFPAMLRTKADQPPLLEKYTVKLSHFQENAAKFTFSASGDLTGPDGTGDSYAPFVSKSKRVTIQPADWAINYGYVVSKQMPPDGFEVSWTYTANFRDEISGPDWQVVAQGLSNTEHRLKLVGKFKSAVARIYTPTLRP